VSEVERRVSEVEGAGKIVRFPRYGTLGIVVLGASL